MFALSSLSLCGFGTLSLMSEPPAKCKFHYPPGFARCHSSALSPYCTSPLKHCSGEPYFCFTASCHLSSNAVKHSTCGQTGSSLRETTDRIKGTLQRTSEQFSKKCPVSVSFKTSKRWGWCLKPTGLLFCMVSMAMAVSDFLFSYKARCFKTHSL